MVINIIIGGLFGLVVALGIEVIHLNTQVNFLENRYHMLIEEMEYYRRKINEHERPV